MKTFYRHAAAPTRVTAALSREEPFALEARNQGIGRVIFVVLLLHALVLGGLAAFKWGSGEGTVVSAAAPPAGSSERPVVADGGLGPRQISGQRIVVDHPDMPGYKRYRVVSGEQLVEIVRQFQASVAEVEKLNNLKPGDPLYAGQWLTIPDHGAARTGSPGAPASGEAIKAVAIAPEKPGSSPGATKRAVAEVAAAERLGAGTTYRVARGDTAYSIARRHGVDWQELLRENGLKDPRQLRADQVIRIP